MRQTAGNQPQAKTIDLVELFYYLLSKLHFLLLGMIAGAVLRNGVDIVLVIGLILSIGLMGLAASFIARLLNRYRWIAYVGLAIIFYVALKMIWEGAHEVRPLLVAWLG